MKQQLSRVLSFVLVIALLLSLSAPICGAEVTAPTTDSVAPTSEESKALKLADTSEGPFSGNYGSLNWTLDPSIGHLEITGTGSMSFSSPPWEQLNKLIRSVSVAEGITTIGTYAFNNCINLTEVSLPSTLVTLDDYAFSSCNSLENIHIPENVTAIKDSVFSHCTELTEVILPSGLRTLGSRAFDYCMGLTSVDLPDEITSLKRYTFDYCNNLVSVKLPKNIQSMEANTFGLCPNLQTVIVDEENPYFCNDGYGVLYSKDMTRLIYCPPQVEGHYVIPQGVTQIAPSAFDHCTKITSVTIPNSITTISGSAFRSCNALREITIPNSVTKIQDLAFAFCPNLESIRFGNSVTHIGSQAFYSCASLTEITIPDSVKEIGDYAFSLCTNIKAISIGNHVERIGTYAFSNCSNLTSISLKNVSSIGNGAFSSCYKLLSVIINNPKCTLEGDSPWSFESQVTFYLPAPCTAIEDYAARRDHEVVIYSPTGCTSNHCYYEGRCIICHREQTVCEPTWQFHVAQGHMSFYDSIGSIYGNESEHPWTIYSPLVKSVSIYSMTDYIGAYAFSDFAKLESIEFPSTVRKIYYHAFDGCASLTTLTLPDHIIYMEDYAFSNCTALETVNLGNGISYLHNNIFENCTSLKEVIFGDNLISIDHSVFANCTSLEKIHLPASVNAIASTAFSSCTSLTAIQVAENNPYFTTDENGVLYSKDQTILYRCPPGLSGSFAVADTVVEIAEYAFADCARLTEILIPSTVEKIGAFAFSGCISLTSIAIPEGITELSSHLLSNCSALKTVQLPRGLTHIGAYAFYKCTALTEIVLPESVTHMGNNSFSYCTSLHEILLPNTLTDIGTYAFSYCSALTEISLPNSVSNIGGSAFYYCDNLREFDFPDRITVINDSTFFGCSRLSKVTLPQNLTTIGRSAFAYCAHLLTLTLPKSVKTISYGAFTDTGVWHIHFTGDMPTMERNVFSTKGYLRLCYLKGMKGWENCTYPTSRWEPEQQYEDCFSVTYACQICSTGITLPKEEVHSWDAGTVITPSTCSAEGESLHRCTVCGMTKTLPLKTVPHSYVKQISESKISYTCTLCSDTRNTGNVDEDIRIVHSLDLLSDISIHFVVPAAQLAEYESFYMELHIPLYEGNDLVGYETREVQPVLKEELYYFSLNGTTAISMNDLVEATLHMEKEGYAYVSLTDRYSVATYAYAQLDNSAANEKLKTVCADILRYGSTAQGYKAYRTDAPADQAMTDAHKAYLSDVSSIRFGQNNKVLEDIEAPCVTWFGKTLLLESRVVVRYVIDTSAYTGAVEDLRLRISYVDMEGQRITAELSELTPYGDSASLYAFDFPGLYASELRCVLSAAVYAGDEQISPTLEYSIDTYCNGKSGDLGSLCKAMIAYSDSAKAFFTD